MTGVNAEVVARALDLYNRQDWSRLDEVYREDVEWIDRRSFALWEDVGSRAALGEFFASTHALAESMTMTAEILEEDGDLLVASVLVAGRVGAEAGGGDLEIALSAVVTLRDGLIAGCECYDEAATALQELRKRAEPQSSKSA